MEIIVFGDSIAYGAWDKEGGWVQRLRKILDVKTLSNPDQFYLVYNLSIDGADTELLLKCIDSEIKHRIQGGSPLILMFAVGVNDSCFVTTQNANAVSQEKFVENLRSVIDTAERYTQTIVFVGLTPVDESRTTPVFWDAQKHYKNKNIKEYNELIRSVCEGENVHFIDLFQRFAKTDYNALLEEGWHPNSEGHKEIFEIVKAYLIEKKILDL